LLLFLHKAGFNKGVSFQNTRYDGFAFTPFIAGQCRQYLCSVFF